MSSNILTEVDGWTPLIDELTKELGLVTSAVYGRMWRFCRGERRVCDASLETIATDLHLDKATVMRHAKKLCDEGYMMDLTPNLRNSPHTYADTGKIRIYAKVGVAHDNATVAENNATVAENQLKIDIKKDINKKEIAGGPALSEGQSYLLQSLGGKRLNPKQRDTILELERTYGTDRLREVIDWAADRGMAVGVAVPAIKTAIPKWGQSRAPTNGSKPAAQENAFDRMRREMDAAQ